MQKKVFKERKVYNVSVGVPAFNEEKNIVRVITDILKQEEKGWKLKELIVFCDGVRDKTYKLAKEVGGKSIKVYNFRTRCGKSHRVNQMLKVFKGDILIIFDADIFFSGNSVITNIIKEFAFEGVGLVSGNCRVFPANNFFQRAIFTSYYVYYKSREKFKSGHNVFGCTGACLAVKKDLAEKIDIPKGVVNEDTFLYFSCLKEGFKFRHAKSSLVFHKLAANTKDFIRQILRTHPEAVHLAYTKYFGELVNQEYKRPADFYLKSILEVFIMNPLGTLYMIALKLFCKPLFPFFSSRYKLNWFTAASTK